MIINMLPSGLSKADFPLPPNPPVEVWTHEVNSDGSTVTLTGCNLTQYIGEEISLPESIDGKKVTHISNLLFNANTGLVKRVVINQPVKFKYKGTGSFTSGAITELVMNVLDFSDYTITQEFRFGSSVTKLTLINGIVSDFLPAKTFYNCSIKLDEHTLDRITKIGDSCFNYYNGNNLTLNNVTKIEGSEFNNCNVTDLNLPSVVHINETADMIFRLSNIINLYLPNLIYMPEYSSNLKVDNLYLDKAEIVELNLYNPTIRNNLYINHCSKLMIKQFHSSTPLPNIYTNSGNVENLKQQLIAQGRQSVADKVKPDPRGDQL